MEKNLYNVVIDKGMLGVYDTNGNEVGGMGSIKVAQDWGLDKLNPNPFNRLCTVEATFVANVFDSKEQMMEAVNKESGKIKAKDIIIKRDVERTDKIGVRY